MLGAAADAGNPSAPKESPGTWLVTPDPAATCGTTRYLARGPALFYGENGGSMPHHNRSVPDLTLLGWVASGDTAALRELEQRHGSSVYALAYGIVIDPGEADEVVAETFAYVWPSAAPPATDATPARPGHGDVPTIPAHRATPATPAHKQGQPTNPHRP